MPFRFANPATLAQGVTIYSQGTTIRSHSPYFRLQRHPGLAPGSAGLGLTQRLPHRRCQAHIEDLPCAMGFSSFLPYTVHAPPRPLVVKRATRVHDDGLSVFLWNRNRIGMT